MHELIGCDVWRVFQQLIIALVPFPPLGNLGKFERGVLPQIVFDLLFGNAVAGHNLSVLDAERDQRCAAAETPNIEMADAVMHFDHFSQGRERLLATIAGGVNRQKPIDAEHGHGAFVALETKLHVIRFPRTFLLVFTETHGVLAGPTESRAIGFPGIPAADCNQYQTNRAADGGIRTKAGAEYTSVAVDIELLSNGTVQQQCRPDITCGGLDAI